MTPKQGQRAGLSGGQDLLTSTDVTPADCGVRCMEAGVGSAHCGHLVLQPLALGLSEWNVHICVEGRKTGGAVGLIDERECHDGLLLVEWWGPKPPVEGSVAGVEAFTDIVVPGVELIVCPATADFTLILGIHAGLEVSAPGVPFFGPSRATVQKSLVLVNLQPFALYLGSVTADAASQPKVTGVRLVLLDGVLKTLKRPAGLPVMVSDLALPLSAVLLNGLGMLSASAAACVVFTHGVLQVEGRGCRALTVAGLECFRARQKGWHFV